MLGMNELKVVNIPWLSHGCQVHNGQKLRWDECRAYYATVILVYLLVRVQM